MTLKDKMKKNLFEEQSTTSSREQDGGTYRGAAVGEICIRGGHAVEDYVVSCRYALTPHVNIDFSIANLALYAFAVSWYSWLLSMTRFQLILPVWCQNPPNFKVVREW